jgi:hypothetical protein
VNFKTLNYSLYVYWTFRHSTVSNIKFIRLYFGSLQIPLGKSDTLMDLCWRKSGCLNFYTKDLSFKEFLSFSEFFIVFHTVLYYIITFNWLQGKTTCISSDIQIPLLTLSTGVQLLWFGFQVIVFHSKMKKKMT